MSKSSRVRVESSRRGRSLRIDGTFASFYDPERVTTGSVWDALVAPLLWLPPPKRRSVLILGLGGGSAARLVRNVAPRARIVAGFQAPKPVRFAMPCPKADIARCLRSSSSVAWSWATSEVI